MDLFEIDERMNQIAEQMNYDNSNKYIDELDKLLDEYMKVFFQKLRRNNMEDIKEIKEILENMKTSINKIEEKLKDDYFDDKIIDFYNNIDVPPVSKYNPIRSLDYPPEECLASWKSISNDLLIPTTQACYEKENNL